MGKRLFFTKPIRYQTQYLKHHRGRNVCGDVIRMVLSRHQANDIADALDERSNCRGTSHTHYNRGFPFEVAAQ